jgi:hypothetical protein
MRAKLLLTVCALVVCALGGWFAGRQPPPSDAPQRAEPTPPAAAVVPREPKVEAPAKPVPNATSVSLTGAYTTRKQTGLKLLPFGPGTKHPLFAHLDNSGSSNAFLVSAPDISGALVATKSVLLDVCSAGRVDPMDPLTADEKSGPNKLWLFAFLGPVCDAEHWVLNEVVVGEREIVLRCARADTTVDARVGETTGQAFWCPLPLLQLDKEYQIVVRDGESELPMLTRRVRIAWR